MEKIIILDFGSQTTQLIGRRLRELNEYCEILPYNKFPENTEKIKGVILSGSPFSVYDPTAFKTDLSKIRGQFPVLGICYGAQYMAYTSGGAVESAGTREYGRANLSYIDAVVEACDITNIDPEDVKKYISPLIKERIEVEARNLNFLPNFQSR